MPVAGHFTTPSLSPQFLRGKRLVLTIAAAAALVACGGGSDSPAPVAATPESVITALRGKAATLTATATPAEAAELLFALGESEFQQYFDPAPQSTQTLFPFLYRHYPGTGTYLGVVVEPNAAFTLYGVYVMGGAFGSAPIYVGQLTTFLPDVQIGTGGGGGGGGVNNGCFDLALFDTEGTRSIISYNYSGTITGNQTVDSTVGPVATFEGQTGRQTVATTAGSNTIDGITAAINTTNTFYATRTGDAEMTQYGGVSVAAITSPIAMTTSIKIVANPPWVSRQYGLAIGESETTTNTSTVTTTFTGAPFPIPPVISTPTTTQTTKYLKRENIFVLGKTLDTCVFEVTAQGSSAVTTSYIAFGKGLPVKITSDGQTIEATSATINGAPI